MSIDLRVKDNSSNLGSNVGTMNVLEFMLTFVSGNNVADNQSDR